MYEAIDWERLRVAVIDQFALGEDSAHGPAHWRRVERYGLYLAMETGADVDVVRLFSLFHDAARLSEEDDPGHGTRGAALAMIMHKRGLVPVGDAGMRQLLEACDCHTVRVYHADPTVATCLDADRLDLARYGIRPDPAFLSTSAARDLASEMPEHGTSPWVVGDAQSA